jgi:hypothetical protein
VQNYQLKPEKREISFAEVLLRTLLQNKHLNVKTTFGLERSFQRDQNSATVEAA